MDVLVGACCSFDISSIGIADSLSSGCSSERRFGFIIVSIRTSVRGAAGRCVIGTYCNVAVASGIVAVGAVPVISGFTIVGGCKIGPFLIQLIISVTDDMCSTPVNN